MFRYKSNKQAFIIAALVFLLCLICLTGATFALFTNDPNDGTIGIITTAGEVKVDIVDDTNAENSLVGQVLQIQTSSENKEVKFEPGVIYYTQGFKVKNLGDIPINFRLSVSEDESIDMDEFREAFELWISTTPADPENAVQLTEFTGKIPVGQSTTETYYLYIRMKKTAGNEFQGKTYSGIGVTVYAVQGNADIKE